MFFIKKTVTSYHGHFTSSSGPIHKHGLHVSMPGFLNFLHEWNTTVRSMTIQHTYVKKRVRVDAYCCSIHHHFSQPNEICLCVYKAAELHIHQLYPHYIHNQSLIKKTLNEINAIAIQYSMATLLTKRRLENNRPLLTSII